MKTLAALLLASCVLAQPVTVVPEIRGVVRESGTQLPVADAEISLSVQDAGPVSINGGWKKDSGAQTRTDERGRFRLTVQRLARYRVEANQPAYIADETPGASHAAEVTLTDGQPTAEVMLFLARSGQLIGRVVDEETRKPIANLRLRAVRNRPPSGFLRPDAKAAATDAKGEFVAPDLLPGEYAVEIFPQAVPEKRVLTKFTDREVETIDRDYEHTYWPGGHGPDTVLPLTVSSGATVHAGEFPVRKVPYYRAHVLIPESDCQAGEMIHIIGSTLRARGARISPLGRAPCGKDVLVTGYAPGNYRLLLSIEGRDRGNRRTASIPFTVIDKNLEIRATLLPGIAVDTAFVAADGAKEPDVGKVTISLRPVDLVSSPEDALALRLGPDANVRFEDVRVIGHRLMIVGLPPGNYVKEVRYNGAPLHGNLVPLDGGAMGHALTVVVDDKPGAITGAVVNRGEPVSQPFVIARKWPPADEEPPWGWTNARGDRAGRFQISGLAPGEYRVIAMRQMDPGMTFTALEQTVAAGEKVELGPNGLATVTMECSDPRR